MAIIYHTLAIRIIFVILFGFVNCNSKQILQSLLRQNNNILLSRSSDSNTTKDARNLLQVPPSLPPLEVIGQTNSYQEFHKLFYGVPESKPQLEENSGPNDIHRERAGTTTQDLDDVRQANEHFLKIRTTARCSKPKSKVIRVKDYYPDSKKEYLPRCTIVYRCGDDSGCCDNDAFQCVPRMVQEIVLPFYTLYVEKHDRQKGNTIEKLLFVNHTQCECQPVNDKPRVEENTSTDNAHHDSNPIQRVNRCRECPIPFYRREFSDGRCSCDCFDRQRPCLRIKRGRDSLVEVERRCVESGYCHIPECEYGEYDLATGQCPKRLDADGQKKSGPKNHAGHRWTYFERD